MSTKLKVILCWHMHQPAYCDLHTNQYQLPWTYLHGIKDYVDMVAHLEAVPKAKAVVNFAPTLLEQIDDYATQLRQYLTECPNPQQAEHFIRDPFLAALVKSPLAPFSHEVDVPEHEARLNFINQCLRANKERLIQRFAPYQKLVNMVTWLKNKPDILEYLGDQYFIDLIVWYHLAWMGEMVRRQDQRIKTLMEKAQGFDQDDRRLLLEIILEIMSSLIPRYRALAEKGQIELSATPYAHPIVPLLLDIKAAAEAVPNVTLPSQGQYPGGKERIRWHVQKAFSVFQKYFGKLPQGFWPSEGSVSEMTVRELEKHGIRWVASGYGVLRNSLTKANLLDQPVHHPYRLPNSQVSCFFRDDHFSDLIGFEFAKWHADDAVAHLTCHLENIATTLKTDQHVVSIILDGENAWEYYPENGYYFLSALYRKLSDHPKLELSTFSECLTKGVTELPTLVAGSWVYGNFATWIGSKDKNRGWDMLIEAKQTYDRVINALPITQRQLAEQQLAICEGSDWCWWFGDYNPTSTVHDFDRLYRLHLTHLYRLLKQPPPEYLQHTFSHGGGDPATGGVMRTGQEPQA